MSQKKAAVFCHSGLGDAIICTLLSHNLMLNGWFVETYQDALHLLRPLFPDLLIASYPKMEEATSVILEKYDLLLIMHDDSNPFVLSLIEEGKKRFPDKVKVIYPYPNEKIRQNPYYEDSLLDPSQCFVYSLKVFCHRMLNLPLTSLHNGITPLDSWKKVKYPKRVILHVSSSRKGKNWPIEKYVKLALHLQKKGYDPVFVTGSQEEREQALLAEREGFSLPECGSLIELAQMIYESSYFVGNDSGVGHLASSLGLPTVTISRRKKVARFWRPGFSQSEIITPPSWIPNVGGFRLRDRKWKWFISVKKVCKVLEKEILPNENKAQV